LLCDCLDIYEHTKIKRWQQYLADNYKLNDLYADVIFIRAHIEWLNAQVKILR